MVHFRPAKVAHFDPAWVVHFNPARVVYYVRRLHFEDVSEIIRKAILEVFEKNDTGFNLCRTALEIALKKCKLEKKQIAK